MSAPGSSVAPPRTWLIRAALVAAATALLGTSQAPDPSLDGATPSTTYQFERSVAGESIELTQQQPRVLFLVTIRATGLGPFGATTTDVATASFSGTIQASGLDDAAPGVTIDVGDGQRVTNAQQNFSMKRPLKFEGTCDAPAEDAPCQASLTVELSRDDDGQAGGTLAVDWSLLLEAQGSVAEQHDEQEPLDPPWSVEVERP